MAWTKEPPTKAGYYWHRVTETYSPTVVQLEDLEAAFPESEAKWVWWFCGSEVDTPHERSEGEWWDVPIPEPPTEKPKNYTCKSCGKRWKEPTPNPHDIAYYGELKSCPDCKDYAPPTD